MKYNYDLSVVIHNMQYFYIPLTINMWIQHRRNLHDPLVVIFMIFRSIKEMK